MLIGQCELRIGAKVDSNATTEDYLSIQSLLDELCGVVIVENNDDTAE